MKVSEWITIKKIEDFSKSSKSLKVGDKFLFGEKMLGQRENKGIGDNVAYWEVTKKEGNDITYIQIIDRLEEG